MTEKADLAVPQDLAQAVLDYLAQRPYGEVYQLVARLLQCQPVKDDQVGEPPSSSS